MTRFPFLSKSAEYALIYKSPYGQLPVVSFVSLYLFAATFTLQVSFFPFFNVATIVVFPAFFAVTFPFLSTVATDFFVDFQDFTVLPLTDNFFENPAVSVNFDWLMVAFTFF